VHKLAAVSQRSGQIFATLGLLLSSWPHIQNLEVFELNRTAVAAQLDRCCDEHCSDCQAYPQSRPHQELTRIDLRQRIHRHATGRERGTFAAAAQTVCQNARCWMQFSLQRRLHRGMPGLLRRVAFGRGLKATMNNNGVSTHKCASVDLSCGARFSESAKPFITNSYSTSGFSPYSSAAFSESLFNHFRRYSRRS